MSKNVVLIHGAFCGGWCFADIMPVFAARGWTCQAPDLPFHVPGPTRDARSAARGAEHRRLHARHGGVRGALSRAADHRRPFHGRAHRPAARRPGSRPRAGAARARRAMGRAAVDRSRDGARQGADDGVALLEQGAQSVVRRAKGNSLASLDPQAQRRIFDMFSAESGLALFELFFWMFDLQRTTAVETSKVTCPVLVVSGSDDKVISPVTGRKVAALYANAHVRGGRRPRALPHHGGGGRAARRALCRLDRQGHQLRRGRWPCVTLQGYDRRAAQRVPRP